MDHGGRCRVDPDVSEFTTRTTGRRNVNRPAVRTSIHEPAGHRGVDGDAATVCARPPDGTRAPTSAILTDLLLHAPGDAVALGWLLGSLGDRSFGILLLLLGAIGSFPGGSVPAGIVILFPAGQMILGRHGPILPGFLAARAFPRQRLGAALRRIVPPLRFLERFIRPRWRGPFQTTKRVVGFVTLILAAMLFAPVPLSNVPPGLVIVLLSFAYLEEDGLLLTLALVLAAILMLVGAGAVWGALSAAGWLG